MKGTCGIEIEWNGVIAAEAGRATEMAKSTDYPMWLRYCAFFVAVGTLMSTLLIFDRPRPIEAYFALPVCLGLGAGVAWLIKRHDRKRSRRWW
jgi:hypothetical protein